MSCCSISSASPTKYFLTLSRAFFGIWLIWLGLDKSGYLTNNPDDSFLSFVYQFIAPTFEGTILPHSLVVLAGWVIALGEPLLGLALLVGKRLRCVWTLTSILMFILAFGQTALKDYQNVNNIWFYLVFAIVNGALAGYEDECYVECCDDDDCCDESCETSCGDSKKECCQTSCSGEKKDSCCS